MEKPEFLAALSALAQETRMDIFRLLVAAGAEGMAAGQIGKQLDLPSATLSFHLNQLRRVDLVTSRRQSRSIIYSANYRTMEAIMGVLTETCWPGQPAPWEDPSVSVHGDTWRVRP